MAHPKWSINCHFFGELFKCQSGINVSNLFTSNVSFHDNSLQFPSFVLGSLFYILTWSCNEVGRRVKHAIFLFPMFSIFSLSCFRFLDYVSNSIVNICLFGDVSYLMRTIDDSLIECKYRLQYVSINIVWYSVWHGKLIF